jgi:hypothetical protein
MSRQPHTDNPAWSGTDWRRAIDLAHAAPRCHARCKHSKAPCRQPAVAGRRVCRMHGGKGGAPKGERNGAYRHGRRTQAAAAERRELARGRADLRALMRAVKEWESE